MSELAHKLGISASEVSESLNRSKISGLIDNTKKKVNTRGLLELLIHGLKYVFPVEPGPVVRGIPTSYSAPPLNEKIRSNENIVWPYVNGNTRGQAVQPLYPSAVEAALKDQELYELLALTDVFRTGRIREKELAEKEFEKRIVK